MKASEDTKYGLSVVADTLRSLTEQAKVCRDRIDQLEAGQSFNRGEVLSEIGRLLDASQHLREAILSEDSGASWATKNELSALVTRLDDAAAKRRRHIDLAQLLATGTITHRRERTRQEKLALRDAAVSELMEMAERSTPPQLPGPAIDGWLQWACSLEDDTDEPEIRQLKSNFPRLDDFVRQIEIEWWHDGPESGPSADDAPVTETIPSVVANLSSTLRLDVNEAELLNQSVVTAEPTVDEPASDEELAPAASISCAEEKEEEPSPLEADSQGEPEQPGAPLASSAATGEEEEIPAEMLKPTMDGKISFFSWDQVEQFTRYIERAKVERKDARTVRALLAVSHWLEPQEQNPLAHPKCGIRALSGLPAASSFDMVTPGDVMHAIAEDDGLPLLTGGADLLRWGLLQPSERNFQGIACVRRFSREHLKAWFSDIYRIALSDKQIDDIYALTSGIPILVRELHRLIIPAPEDPPTWLGLARWIEIKEVFEKQIPAIAHELKKGTPAVRLTDREISLLNMVVIVSNDSTPETILSNLSENWVAYHRPEYRALSSRDDVSLAVLFDLGLLPRRNVVGVEPTHALLPVKQDDAIRKLVEHI